MRKLFSSEGSLNNQDLCLTAISKHSQTFARMNKTTDVGCLQPTFTFK